MFEFVQHLAELFFLLVGHIFHFPENIFHNALGAQEFDTVGLQRFSPIVDKGGDFLLISIYLL